MDAAMTMPEEATERFVPLPRQLTDSQLAAIADLPSHDTAEVHTIEAQRPARIYCDPARFDAEMEAIFHQFAMPALPSCALEKGSFHPIEAFGFPILLTRDRDGVARAFHNVCTHRGSKLVDGCDALKAGRVTCPYHAWSFGLDGKLLAIARPETFPSADKSELGMKALPCHETAGYVWIGLKKDSPAILPDGTDALDADLKALGLPDMHVYATRYYDLKSNWKLVVEPFLEAYHVKRLHAKTVAGLNADTVGVMRWMGAHLRQTAGKVHYEPGVTDLGSDSLHKNITHSYYIFPNTIVVTSPYFISTMILMPRAADRTVVQYSMLMPQPIRSPKAEDLFARSYAFQDEIFMEDFGAGVMQQAALAGGGLETVHYGGMEVPIGPFHDQIEKYLPADAI